MWTGSSSLIFVHNLIHFQALFYMLIFRHKQLLDIEEGGTIVKSFCEKFQILLIAMDDFACFQNSSFRIKLQEWCHW